MRVHDYLFTKIEVIKTMASIPYKMYCGVFMIIPLFCRW